MPRLSNRQAYGFAVFIFLITLALCYFFPGHFITFSGFLVVILLTLFIKGSFSTILAGSGAAALIILSDLSIRNSQAPGWHPGELIFFFLLIVFTVLFVIYLKGLYSHMEKDKSHMSSLFENATEGIILTSGKGDIILVNPAAEKMFGYEASELIGQPIEILIPHHLKHKHVRLRDGFYKSPQNRTMGAGRDLNGTRRDGTEFPVEVSLSFYKEGNEAFVIAFIVDITHRKQIESNMLRQKIELERVTEDIRRLNTQLEAKVEDRTLILKEALQKLEHSQRELSEALDKERELNEIKSRFVSMASHEFRTPLSTVLSSASLLARYKNSEDQVHRDKHIEKIKNSVKHLNDILNDFLSVGKLDEGKVDVQPVSFDLKEFISESIEEMKGLLKKGQHIELSYRGVPEVFTDKKLVKNILINLITNASKFSEEGKPITVACDVTDEEAHIAIIDRGIGISKEDQEHLFSSFYRGANAVNIQGTGLGLHIVKRYLDLLGGEVTLQSSLNEGTSVHVTIPIYKSDI
ncbi:MAG TPA: PAS domain S-box protein [Chitinophagaceae bacterium]|nr:PAS domain S-box protein [Chitinophagaceae bacterium]